MIKVLGKVVETIIGTRVKMDVKFYDVLHGFSARRVTGTAIMELKMSQDLDIIYPEPFFLVFLYLRKAHEKLDYGSLLQTLKGYRAVPKLHEIMVDFW